VPTHADTRLKEVCPASRFQSREDGRVSLRVLHHGQGIRWPMGLVGGGSRFQRGRRHEGDQGSQPESPAEGYLVPVQRAVSFRSEMECTMGGGRTGTAYLVERRLSVRSDRADEAHRELRLPRSESRSGWVNCALPPAGWPDSNGITVRPGMRLRTDRTIHQSDGSMFYRATIAESSGDSELQLAHSPIRTESFQRGVGTVG
jgi:hypothetical protein